MKTSMAVLNVLWCKYFIRIIITIPFLSTKLNNHTYNRFISSNFNTMQINANPWNAIVAVLKRIHKICWLSLKIETILNKTSYFRRLELNRNGRKGCLKFAIQITSNPLKFLTQIWKLNEIPSSINFKYLHCFIFHLIVKNALNDIVVIST